MRRTPWYSVRFVSLAVVLFSTPGWAAPPEPQSKQAEQTKALVEKAADLLADKGETAFAEFRKADSEWRKGQSYVFVYGLDGTSLCHPIDPKLEGKNELGLKDVKGKAFVKEMVALMEAKESAWIDYQWPKPGETKPSQKWSYLKRVKVGAETLFVGGGFYPE